MVEEVVWYTGAVNGISSKTISTIFNEERSTKVAAGSSPTWKGKNGLIYASDYGFSMPSSNCARTTNVGNFGTQNCAGNSWLYGGDYYTITPISTNKQNLLSKRKRFHR